MELHPDLISITSHTYSLPLKYTDLEENCQSSYISPLPFKHESLNYFRSDEHPLPVTFAYECPCTSYTELCALEFTC
jgi:hypothetical protein